MRTCKDLCLLCQKNESDKENSHIIPKFFTKSIFGKRNNDPAHKFIGQKIYKNVIQDSPKEDYIFCTGCEKYLALIETQASIYFRNFHTKQINGDEMDRTLRTGNIIKTDCNISSQLFHLFFASIIYRVSISNHRVFRTFKLPSEFNSVMRKFLREFHTVDSKEFKNHLVTTAADINFTYGVFTCVNLPDLKLGTIASASFLRAHLILANRFSIHVCAKNKYEDIFMNSISTVKINLCTFENWNKTFITPVLNINQKS